MNIAIFPLQVQRFDDMQGVYGRQIAREIARALNAEGVGTEVIRWFARRGELRAHVVIEAPLPRDVVAEELARRGATLGLVGSVRIQQGESTLSLALVRLSETLGDVDVAFTFHESAPRESTLWLVDSAVDAILRHLGRPDPPQREAREDVPFEAWSALLVDQDTQSLLHEGGFESLEHPDHAWSHLARAIALLPWSQRRTRRDELRERIDAWNDQRNDDVVLRARSAMCELPDAREHDWQMLAIHAHDVHDLNIYERALRGWSRIASRPELPLLRLGIMLIREQRVQDAIDALLRASGSPEVRDAAETWLGVAYESSGDPHLASRYWQRVAESGTDSQMVELAKRFLHQGLEDPLPA